MFYYLFLSLDAKLWTYLIYTFAIRISTRKKREIKNKMEKNTERKKKDIDGKKARDGETNKRNTEKHD